jgi:hypothetical protein
LIVFFKKKSGTTSGGKSDIILKKTVSMPNYSDDYEIFYPSIGNERWFAHAQETSTSTPTTCTL